MPDLDEWITRQSLENYAGPTLFSRGVAYFESDAVGRLRDIGSKVSARVVGTDIYQVELWTDGAELAYDCTCPHAAEGNFCKHCVAVGLAFLANREANRSQAWEDSPQGIWTRLHEYLLIQPPETLVDWLLGAAKRDDCTYRTLLLAMERIGGSLSQVKALRREIDQAARYCSPDDWEPLFDTLEELLDTEAAALIELTEYAIERVERAIPDLEYDEGEATDIAERLAELHLQACGTARPDPLALAERLFRYDTTSEGYAFHNSLPAYREVLGPSGTQRYRELAEAAWQEVRPLTAGTGHFDSRRLHLTTIMETLAEESGDIDTLAAIKARDLSSGYRYLQIARLYRDANQPEKALQWAELGLEAFPERPDNQLRDFLADLHMEHGRGDAALALVWAQFAEQPELRNYQKLRGLAERLDAWPAQRERTLAEVEREAQHPKHWRSQSQTPDMSLRIEIALYENDPEAAWQAFNRGYCQPGLRMRLAEQLEASRPADALALYLPMIPELVAQTNNESYAKAVELIGIAGELLQRLGREGEFQERLAEWRTAFKMKRNFMKLLDTMGWDR